MSLAEIEYENRDALIENRDALIENRDVVIANQVSILDSILDSCRDRELSVNLLMNGTVLLHPCSTQNSASCYDFMSFFLLNFKILCQVQVLYIGFYKYHISVAMCQHIVVFKRFTTRTDDSFNLYYL